MPDFVPVESHCRACGIGETEADLCRCSKCKTAFYCSRECQVQDWPDHKRQCKRLAAAAASVPLSYDPLSPFAAHRVSRRQDREIRDRQERLRLGTSCGDPSRENKAALALNSRGLQAKRAGRVEEAIKLYSQAIELHGFDHNFFHNRCAAYKLLDKWDMVVIDAKRTLELSSSFPLGWCNLIMGCFYTMNLNDARKAAELAQQHVDRNHELYHFLPQQIMWLDEQLSNPHEYPWLARPVFDEGDPLAFLYTDGLRLRDQQELLIVDVPRRAVNSIQKKVLHALVMTGQVKPGKRLDLGEILKVRGYKVIAIPVEDEEQVKVLKWHLLGQKVKGSEMTDEGLHPGGVVILKVCKSKRVSAPTEDQAKSYIDAIVANAHACKERYNKGIRLVEDDATHNDLA